jgi:hypothetical protein
MMQTLFDLLTIAYLISIPAAGVLSVVWLSALIHDTVFK